MLTVILLARARGRARVKFLRSPHVKSQTLESVASSPKRENSNSVEVVRRPVAVRGGACGRSESDSHLGAVACAVASIESRRVCAVSHDRTAPGRYYCSTRDTPPSTSPSHPIDARYCPHRRKLYRVCIHAR